jgi:AcrR family transcriptional regulator
METRERIMQCAFAELEQSGVERFSLRSVGAAAGLSAMAIYRHFESKEALLQALGEAAFATWADRIKAIRAKDLHAWFDKGLRAYVEFALDEPARFDVCFVFKTNVERRYPADFRAGKSPAVSLLMGRIESGQSEGKLRSGDALEMAMYLWAQLHGLVMLHRAGRFAMARKDFIALCKRCSDRALEGLAVP